MALTLIESAKLALNRDERLLYTVMDLYARSSNILQVMPFMDIGGTRSITFNREQTLPAAGKRKLNSGYTESTGTVDKVREELAIYGGDVDIDKMLLRTGSEAQRAVQEEMQIKSLGLAVAKTVIKGDVESDPDEFDGLQARLIGDQLIDAGSSAGGDALSLAKLDELIDEVVEPTHLIMNKAMRRRLSAAARATSISGYISWQKDLFGQPVMFYGELPILIADKDNNYSDIMPFNEAAASGSSVCTSVYCVSFADNGVVGIQSGNVNVTDLGELDTVPVYRTRVEWYVSMAILRAKAAARLRYIKNAAIVA